MRKKKETKRKLTKSQLLNMLLEKEDAEIQQMDEMVDLLISKNVTVNVNSEREDDLTTGEKMSDAFAKFAGSWGFIIIFAVILIVWIIANIVFFVKPFDPYPFILLNLLLSCVAALQAPVIMMSQNRQEKKDRIRGDNDYKINLKAEFILEDMHNKLEKVIEEQEKIRLDIKELQKK